MVILLASLSWEKRVFENGHVCVEARVSKTLVCRSLLASVDRVSRRFKKARVKKRPYTVKCGNRLCVGARSKISLACRGFMSALLS